ncbi:MAG: YciI family protein [Gammaproteobacteria bacterium]|nr:YciI family protein [Gammaproteobacteria bacterium]
MLYVIFATDHPNSLAARKLARPDHLARLELLKAQDRLFLAGPFPAIDNNDPGEAGFSGSMIVAEFNNLIDAENWAKVDPYIKAGVYKNVIVKPFKKVLP